MTAMRVATPPDRSSGPAVMAATVAVVAVRTAVTAGAVLAGATALAQRDQLAARPVWIAALAGLVVVAVWGVRRGRSTAAVTAAVA